MSKEHGNVERKAEVPTFLTRRQTLKETEIHSQDNQESRRRGIHAPFLSAARQWHRETQTLSLEESRGFRITARLHPLEEKRQDKPLLPQCNSGAGMTWPAPCADAWHRWDLPTTLRLPAPGITNRQISQTHSGSSCSSSTLPVFKLSLWTQMRKTFHFIIDACKSNSFLGKGEHMKQSGYNEASDWPHLCSELVPKLSPNSHTALWQAQSIHSVS